MEIRNLPPPFCTISSWHVREFIHLSSSIEILLERTKSRLEILEGEEGGRVWKRGDSADELVGTIVNKGEGERVAGARWKL